MYLNQGKKLKYLLVLRPIVFIFALFVVFSLFSCKSAEAATRTWKGTTSTSWGTATNWNEGVIPANGDDLVFPASGASNKSTSNNISSLSVNSITFDGSGFTLATNSITLAGDITDNVASGGNTISLAMALSATRTINVVNSGETLTISGIMSSTGGLTKIGAGILKPSSTSNSYSGVTSVLAGTLNIPGSAPSGSNGILGNATSAVLLGDTSGTADAYILQTAGYTTARPITVQAGSSGIAYIGSSAATSSPTFSGAIALNKDLNIYVNAGATYGPTFSGIISSTGVFGITKTGAGKASLSGANSYTGLTTVSVGTLETRNATGLGTTDNVTVVADGAALQVNVSATISEALTLNGTGISSGGALKSTGWTWTWAGLITLNSASSIINTNWPISITGGITGTNTNLTIGGSGDITISTNGISIGSGSLTKDSTTGNCSLLTLNPTSTYTGDTIINGGYVYVAGNVTPGVDGPLGNSSNAITLGNTSGSIKAGLFINGAYTVSRDITVQAGSSGKAYLGTKGSSSNGVFSGNIILNRDVSLSTYTTGYLTTFSGVISGTGGVIAEMVDGNWRGNVTLTNTNTYTGNTSVLEFGQLNVGANVTAGADGPLGNSSNPITLCDTSGIYTSIFYVTGAYTVTRGFTVQAGSSGVVTIKGANNSVFSGNIAMSKNLTLTTDSSATVTFSGVISGDYALATTIGSGGTIILSGSNTYTGATTVTGSGALNLRTSTATGTEAGGVTISSSSALQLQGGIAVGAEALTLNYRGISWTGCLRNISGDNSWAGAITLSTNDVIIASDANTLTLSGGISGTKNLTITGSGNVTINTTGFNSGGAQTLTKEGTGTLTIAASGNYTGLTTVSQGVLNIQNGSALGTTDTGTTISAGAALQLQGGIAVGAEALTISNLGISSTGVVRNISGNNSWTGAITLPANSRINSDADTLTFSGGFSGASDLTVGGGGNVTITTTGINTGSTKTLTKDGAGTLTISASGNYTGLTTVTAGVLNLQNNTASGTTAGGITLASGAALQLQGGIAVGAEALTLNNDGISSTGCLRNISGNNSYAGAITLSTNNVRINSDADTMTLTGGITGSLNLTVGGSGNVTIGTSGVNTGASKTLTKDGGGTLTISASSNYTGLTTVSAGALNVQHATATGTTAGGVTVTAGAAVQMQGNVTVGAEALTLNGSGVSTDGALRNISGNNTWQGAITLNTASRINSDADLLTLSGGITGNALGLTVGGSGNVAISSVIGTTTGTLTRDGAGNLTLSAANTFTGLTTISAGTVTYGANDTIPSGNSISISNGGTLNIAGYNATNTTISNYGIFQFFGSETVSINPTNYSGSVIKYYGTSGPYNLRQWTYYGLWLASSSSTTYNLVAALTINENLTIEANNTLDTVNGSNFPIDVKGNWTNNGTFTAQSGTVTFSGTGQQTLSGTMTGGSAFNGLVLTNTYGTNDPGCGTSFTPGIVFAASASATSYTITTGAVKVQYHTGSTYTFTDINWNGQASGTKIFFRNSDLGSGTWALNVSGTQTAVSYVNVGRSNAGGGSQITASDGTNTNCLNNTNWSFGGTLSVDIVDADGNPVGSPSIAMGSANFSYVYQTATGSFGASSQKIRVTNTADNPQWTLAMAATDGSTALWSAGTPKYDFNDPTASAGDGGDADSYGGQMTLTASAGTLTPQGGCSNDHLSLSSSTSFSQGVTDSVSLITADSSSQLNCYWDLTGIGVSQTIPAQQTVENYAINMTLTVATY